LSVGAIEQLADSTLTIADFSNVGKVDVVAPGVNIYTTDLNGGYVYRSGTSESAPIITGYAALLKAYNPKLTREELTTIVKDASRNELIDPVHTYDYANFPPSEGKYVNLTMIYGRGLIIGSMPFRSSRLKVIPITDTILPDRTVTMDVYWLDLAGHPAPNSSMVSLNMTLVAEDKPEFTTGSRVDDKVQDIPNGFARISLTVGSDFPVDEPYHYSVYAVWTESVGGSHPYYHDHYSNKIEFIRRPAPPQSTLSSGTYSGTQSVILYTTEEGAEPHFILIGDNTALGGKYVPGHPIPVTEDSFLYAYSRKNDVKSEPVEFLYKITAAPVVVPAGGGCCAAPPLIGGGAPAGGNAGAGEDQPKVTTEADGTKSAEFTPDAAKLLSQLRASSSELSIDATTADLVDRVTLNLDAGLIRAANEEKKAIVVAANGVDLRIPPGTVPAGDEAKQTRLTFHTVNKPMAPDSAGYLSAMYDFSITMDGQPVSQFGVPVEAAFHVNATQVTDPLKAGVYRYSNGERPWVYAGGVYDAASGVMRVKLPHFSSYAVLQFDKSFADIQGHWAQREIEIMAARQIVDGMTETEFAPETPVMRAQFTALLTRALGLDESAVGTGADAVGADRFDDVPADAWYRASVEVAYRAGIVGGVGDREFAPDEQITREQMAVMLVGAYNRLAGTTLADSATTQEVKFTDEGTVSGWARENVRLAASLRLMDGSDDGAFYPQQSATRAQAAAVIYRLLTHPAAAGK
jgi:hypothetical protein